MGLFKHTPTFTFHPLLDLWSHNHAHEEARSEDQQGNEHAEGQGAPHEQGKEGDGPLGDARDGEGFDGREEALTMRSQYELSHVQLDGAIALGGQPWIRLGGL